MRGSDRTSGSLFSYVDMEQRIPTKHPLRVIKAIVDNVLVSLDADFERHGSRVKLVQRLRTLRTTRPSVSAILLGVARVA